MTRTFKAAAGITAIDTRMFSRENVTSAYLIDGQEPALVETGSTLCVDEIAGGLGDLGIGPGDLAHVVVTHIHLDHAGGAGAMAARFPEATVWVHERGAPHLADPTKLVASAERIYGVEGLRELFGTVEPVPAGRIRPLRDGDQVPFGDRSLEALDTPGHASHHACLVDSSTGAVFVGDAFGVFLPDAQLLRPATPPPEFDLELAIASIRRVREREPSRILFSHFGPSEDVRRLCDLAVARLEEWTGLVREALTRTEEMEEIVQILREGTAGDAMEAKPVERSEVEERYELLSSYEMNAMGIARYLRKRDERGD